MSATRASEISVSLPERGQANDRYKWVALSNTTRRRPAGHDRLLDHVDRHAGHLPRHPARPPGARQQLLPAVDDPGLPGRQQRAGGQPRPPRRHVRPGAHVQPRLRHLHRRLAAADHRLADRRGRRALADRRSASSRAWAPPSWSPTRPPSSPTPSPPTSAAWRWASTTSPASAASFIGLVLGGVLAPINWRLVFLVSVPVRPVRHGVGLSQAGGARHAPPGADRLAGQHHLRRRA